MFGLFGAGQVWLSGNAEFLRLFKLTAEQARGRRLPELMKGKLALPLTDRGDIARLLELATVTQKKRTRQHLCVELSGARLMEFLFSPTPDGFSMQAEDATRRRAEEIRVERMARTDDVTGMANRAAFREILETAAAEATENPFAIFMIDLDRFKQVNDSLGHAVGDKLLQARGDAPAGYRRRGRGGGAARRRRIRRAALRRPRSRRRFCRPHAVEASERPYQIERREAADRRVDRRGA